MVKLLKIYIKIKKLNKKRVIYFNKFELVSSFFVFFFSKITHFEIKNAQAFLKTKLKTIFTNF
jgi:hypothetical protein